MSISETPAGRKRLLLVSYAFPPVLAAESIMVLKKVRVLARHFSITLVALDNANGPFPHDGSLERYIPDNVRVIRVAGVDATSPLRRTFSLATRALAGHSDVLRYFDFTWAARATSAIRQLLAGGDEFDLVMTNAQSMCSHLVGLRLRPVMRAPWIQHYSDPFLGAAFQGGHSLSNAVDSRYIRRFLRGAALITLPAGAVARAVSGELDASPPETGRRPVLIVPHTFDRDMAADGVAEYADRSRYFTDLDAFHLCYVGNLYGLRGGSLIADVARRLQGPTGRRTICHVFGRTDAKSLRQLTQAGIAVHQGTGYLESLAVMQHADALLVVDVPRDRSPFFPSKLADYLGTDRPVIVVADPGSAVAEIARDMDLTFAAWDDRPIAMPERVAPDALARREHYNGGEKVFGELIEQLERLRVSGGA